MLLELLQPAVLIPWLLGMVFGIFVGSTPGLTATMAVALIVPISYHLDPTAGLALIIGVSFTAIFAGDLPAVFLRIPGTPASAAATLDGHAMAQRGQGGTAVLVDLMCSSFGGVVGVLLLIFAAPQLARFALTFTDYEYFWLGVGGLSLSALVSQGNTMRGLASAALGMLLATIGQDIATGAPRFTLGSEQLLDGLSFIPAMIGLFGIAEVLRNIGHSESMDQAGVQQKHPIVWWECFSLVWVHKWLALFAAGLGTLIGALPGAGADIAAWGAYGVAQKTSKTPEEFGKGCAQGVVAPTSANNAAVAGAWIPALVFGIPGDAVTAIVINAFRMYGLQTGPLIFEQSGGQVRQLFLIALLTQVLLIPAGLVGLLSFRQIMRFPKRIILVGVVLFSLVGSYAIRSNVFDVYVMFAFGVLGFVFERLRFPLAPLILGMILGDMVEEHLRVGMIQADGDFTVFFTRPISAVLVAGLILAFVLAPAIRWWASRKGGTPDAPNKGNAE